VSSYVRNAQETLAPKKKPDSSSSSYRRPLVIKDCRIWTGSDFREGSLLIENGRISKVGIDIPTLSNQINAKGLLALPGLIDAHVHLRDMDLAYKEDFASGTASAAAGGFTSVLDMPNSKPPVDSADRLLQRMEVASRKVLINVGFHVVAVDNVDRLKAMADLGAFSLKLYMPRPISPIRLEDDREVLGIMKNAGLNNIPFTVHAEDPSMIRDSFSAESYLSLARTRPAGAEVHAVGRILRLQRLSHCSVHFAHITLAANLARIQDRHLPSVTSEVTPHHLLLSQQDLKRLGWKAWMVPPLRVGRVSQRLLSATSRGMATLIASDHAPHAIEEKKSGLAKAPPGIPGLETTLPLLMALVSRGKLSMKRMLNLLTIAPARVFGLPTKGRLVKGADGDVVLMDPTIVSKVNPARFLSKAKYSPFEGFETRGRVEKTIVGGTMVYDRGKIVASGGTGEILKRAR
jgi:dihydroorotase